MAVICLTFCCLLLLLHQTRGDVYQDGTTCLQKRHKGSFQIEGDADLLIGVLVDAHQPGTSGLSGCGTSRLTGVGEVEVLRYALTNINRRAMSTDPTLREMALPRLRIGLHVHDSCGHERKGLQQLSSMFPILEDGVEGCVQEERPVLGVIDLTSLSSSSLVKSSLAKWSVPALPVQGGYFDWISDEKLSVVMLNVTKLLGWSKVTFLTDSRGQRLTDVFQAHSAGSELCVSHHRLAERYEEDDAMYENLRQLFDEVLDDDEAVLTVVKDSKVLSVLLKTLARHFMKEATNYKWVFHVIPDLNDLEEFKEVVRSTGVYSLALEPGLSSGFESHWTHILDSAMNPWSLDLPEPHSNIGVLGRASSYIPLILTLENFVDSIRRASVRLCQGQEGNCKEMIQLKRSDFYREFFNRSSHLKEPEDLDMMVVQYNVDHEGRMDFEYVGVHQDPTSPNRTLKNRSEQCSKKKNSRTKKMSDSVSIGDSSDLFIPFLLPLHKSDSKSNCGSELNPSAIQDLESALFIVDKINSDLTFLNGVKLGLRVIDSCSSSFKLVEGLSQVVLPAQPTDSLSVISSLEPQASEIVSSLLSPLNVTLISTVNLENDVVEPSHMEPYILQIPPSSAKTAKAIVEFLKKFSFKQVSVVESHNKNRLGYLKHHLMEAGVCIEAEELLSSQNLEQADRVVENLSASNARVVILSTDSSSIRKLFEAVNNRLKNTGTTANVVWLIASEQNANFEGLEGLVKGAVIFSPLVADVSEFESHFKKLRPETNRRNPFFQEFWEKTMVCKDTPCNSPLPYTPSVSVGNTMQAVLSVAAAIARAKNEMCGPQHRGLCTELTVEPNIRNIFNHFLRFTASIQPDANKEMFSFTRNGQGNSEILLFNLRRSNSGPYLYQKVGLFNQELSELQPIVSYDTLSREILLENVKVPCSEHCEHCQDSDILLRGSDKDIFLLGAFDITEASTSGEGCSDKIKVEGVKMVEAFLWALEEANTKILKGKFQLGAAIFDTCRNPYKIVKEMAEVLSGGSLIGTPSDQNALALLVDTDSRNLFESISALSTTLQIPTISVASKPIEGDNPLIFQYALKEEFIANAMYSLIERMSWKYLSVLKSSRSEFQNKIYQFLMKRFEAGLVSLAITENISQDSRVGAIESGLKRLIAKRDDGARVVLLLSTPEETELFLSVAKGFQKMGQMRPNEFLFLSYENVEIFQKFSEQGLGALAMRKPLYKESTFYQHYDRLNRRNATRNPWLAKYWQSKDCQGSSCESESRAPDHALTNVIKSVVSFATAAAAVHGESCLDGKDCLGPKNRKLFKRMVLDRTKDVVLTRNNQDENNFGHNNLEILNLKMIGKHTLAFAKVGSFADNSGLKLNTSDLVAYDGNRQELSLSRIPSKCVHRNQCRTAVRSIGANMLVKSQENLLLGIMLPLHKKGHNAFNCGPLREPSVFHNLVAFAYALEKDNLPALGGILFDDCQQPLRAQQKLYEYLESQEYSAHQRFAAFLSLSDNKEIRPILSGSNVTLISEDPSDVSNMIGIKPTTQLHMEALTEFLSQGNWKYVYVIYTEDSQGVKSLDFFKKEATKKGICIAEDVGLDLESTKEEIKNTLKTQLSDLEPRVVVVLNQDSFVTRLILESAKDANLLNRFAWIGSGDWESSPGLTSFLDFNNVEGLTVSQTNPIVSDLMRYYLGLTLEKHEPIPDEWFYEYWQQQFRCRLPNSNSFEYPEVCTGKESLKESFLQSKDVIRSISIVSAVKESLKEFMKENCSQNRNCGLPSTDQLNSFLKKSFQKFDDKSVFQVVRFGNSSGGTYFKEKIGTWSKSSPFKVDFSKDLSPSLCLGSCLFKCTNQLETLSLSQPAQHSSFSRWTYANFHSVWGIVATALSVLGLILVFICAIYFLMTFSLSYGTTVLGYKILFGLFLLYGVNFAFILTPTESVCGVRRFAMGFAYSIVFAGMFLKVLNTWRLMGSDQVKSQPGRMSSPAGLLVASVGLVIIQIVLISAWLILMPPKTGLYNGVYRCAPPDNFEDELVISLIYDMIILAATVIFSLLTWKIRDNGRESRWILACCLFVGVVWVLWTTLSTQLDYAYRDATIVSANLLSATLVMLCLYLRKIYFYSRLKRLEVVKAHLKGPQYHQHNVYGTLKKDLTLAAPVLCGSQASLTSKSFYGGQFDHVQLDETETCGSTASSTVGSTTGSANQVQSADLYPLEMYDNSGSHLSLFAPKSIPGLRETLHYDR